MIFFQMIDGLLFMRPKNVCPIHLFFPNLLQQLIAFFLHTNKILPYFFQPCVAH